MNTFSSFQTHTWFSEMGDFPGMESCVDLKENIEDVITNLGCAAEENSQRRRGKTERRRKEEFPPPPSLARTRSWVLKRHYTSDGRLIIREEKVRRREYFRAHRSCGRLTLELISLDDDLFFPLSPISVGDAEDGREDDYNVESEGDEDHEDGDQCADRSKDRAEDGDLTVEFPPESMAVESETMVVGGGKCHDYSHVRSNRDMFGIPVPAFKPLKI